MNICPNLLTGSGFEGNKMYFCCVEMNKKYTNIIRRRLGYLLYKYKPIIGNSEKIIIKLNNII